MLYWSPGTRWPCSNFGWGILGTVLAKIADPGQSEQPYGAVASSLVTAPRNLASTSIEDCDAHSCV